MDIAKTLAEGGKEVVTALDKRIGDVTGIINTRGAKLAETHRRADRRDRPGARHPRRSRSPTTSTPASAASSSCWSDAPSTSPSRSSSAPRPRPTSLNARMEQLSNSIKTNSADARPACSSKIDRGRPAGGQPDGTSSATQTITSGPQRRRPTPSPASAREAEQTLGDDHQHHRAHARAPSPARPSARSTRCSATSRTLWLGRTEAISGQIETRTKRDHRAARTPAWSSSPARCATNSAAATQALDDASGAAERTLVQVTNAAERTIGQRLRRDRALARPGRRPLREPVAGPHRRHQRAHRLAHQDRRRGSRCAHDAASPRPSRPTRPRPRRSSAAPATEAERVVGTILDATERSVTTVTTGSPRAQAERRRARTLADRGFDRRQRHDQAERRRSRARADRACRPASATCSSRTPATSSAPCSASAPRWRATSSAGRRDQPAASARAPPR